jgi:hypothetical protein
MKRVLIIGFILAILILAMPQGVLADTKTSGVTVNANIQNVLDFTATNGGGSEGWTMTRGTTNTITNGVGFDVKSSAPWSITVAESTTPPLPTPTNNGLMKESDGTAYINGGKFLPSPFEIQRTDDTYQSLLETSPAQKLVENDVANNYIFSKGIRQAVALTDTELPAATRHYAIALTFTCTQTI